MKVKRRLVSSRKSSWEKAVAENINLLHDGTDDLEVKLEAITDVYLRLEKDFLALSNSYRELKLKIK